MNELKESKIEKYECDYCYRIFHNNFMLKDHISNQHNILREVYSSKFYKDIYSRIKKLDSELEEKNKIINFLEKRISNIESQLGK